MKSLLNFLLESKGAALKDRKWDRFFGDEYDKETDLKKEQWRTKKFLKDNKDDISENAYDFLMQLATLRKSRYMERRSSFSAFYYKEWDEWTFDFHIAADNIPKAVETKLHPNTVAKRFKLQLRKQVGLWNDHAGNYSCDGSAFGTTGRLTISFHEKDKAKFFEMFNYVADTLNEIKDAILSYTDDNADEEQIKDKRRREEERKQLKNLTRFNKKK